MQKEEEKEKARSRCLYISQLLHVSLLFARGSFLARDERAGGQNKSGRSLVLTVGEESNRGVQPPLALKAPGEGQYCAFAPIFAVFCIGSDVILCIDDSATQIMLFIGFHALSVNAGQAWQGTKVALLLVGAR